jgi:hypothetical protein
VAALIIPEIDRKLRNFGTNKDNKIKITIKTASGPARVDSENIRLIFNIKESGALIDFHL